MQNADDIFYISQDIEIQNRISQIKAAFQGACEAYLSPTKLFHGCHVNNNLGFIVTIVQRIKIVQDSSSWNVSSFKMTSINFLYLF